jgi:hypothetical protein
MLWKYIVTSIAGYEAEGDYDIITWRAFRMEAESYDRSVFDNTNVSSLRMGVHNHCLQANNWQTTIMNCWGLIFAVHVGF